MSEQAASQTQTETISEADVTDSGSQVRIFVAGPATSRDVTRLIFGLDRDKSLSGVERCTVSGEQLIVALIVYRDSLRDVRISASSKIFFLSKLQRNAAVISITATRLDYAFCYVP